MRGAGRTTVGDRWHLTSCCILALVWVAGLGVGVAGVGQVEAAVVVVVAAVTSGCGGVGPGSERHLDAVTAREVGMP